MTTKVKRSIFKLAPLLLSMGSCSDANLQEAKLTPEFQDHGVAAPVGQAAWGSVYATHRGNGEATILVKLWSGSGKERARRLMLIDPKSGETELHVPPHGPYGQGSFGTLLSSKNRFYNIIGKGGKGRFYEFDLKSVQWSYVGETPSNFAHTFTEDNDGTIYAGMIPNGELLSFDPERKKLVNHGSLLKRKWAVYPHLSTDRHGWVYAATLFKETHIIAFNPATGEKRNLLPKEAQTEAQKVKIYRAKNGNVYVQFSSAAQWYELENGAIALVRQPAPEKELLGNAWRPTTEFGDGARISKISIPNKYAIITTSEGKEEKVSFNYDSSGVTIFSMEAGADGLIYGSTAVPLRFFRYDPASGTLDNWGLGDHGGHINDLARVGKKLYGGLYSSGTLLEIDLEKPWIDAPYSNNTNPRPVYDGGEAAMLVGRPFVVIAHSDARHVLMGGNPSRAGEGSGLIIYDTETGAHETLRPHQLSPGQGILSLTSLNDGTVIAGTTTAAGTGGRSTAAHAEIFTLDWKERRVSQRLALPRFRHVTDLITLRSGEIYGVGQNTGATLFSYSQKQNKLTSTLDLSSYGQLSGTQAPRVLTEGPDGKLYLLFRQAIVRIDPKGNRPEVVFSTDREITAGALWLKGRLYFSMNGNLCSWGPIAASGKH